MKLRQTTNKMIDFVVVSIEANTLNYFNISRGEQEGLLVFCELGEGLRQGSKELIVLVPEKIEIYGKNDV